MTYSRFAWRLRGRIGLPQRIALCAAFAVLLAPYESFGDEPVPTTLADPTSPTPTPMGAPIPPVQSPRAVPPASASVTAAPAHDKPMVSNDLPISESSSLPTDHELVVGAIGIGYIGSYRVPLPLAVPVGRGDQAGMSPNDSMNIRQLLVPTLGVRKWFSKRRGFEAGLGLSLSAGGTSAELGAATATVDKESIFAISAHVGVPIMILDTRHMAFLLVPEATLSLASSNISAEFKENAPPDAKMRGGALDAGLRAGAEVHFGFMGLPRLTLQAGVGIYLTAQWASATVSNQSLTDRSVSVGFGSAGNPWDVFSGVANLSARYYF
jgi:hypothetical protein